MTQHYVYILYRNAEMTDPFYVGAGLGKRFRSHRGPLWETKLRREIMNDLKRTLGYVPHRKVIEGLTKAEAYAREAELIAQIGRMPDGPLVNISPNAGYGRKPGYQASAGTKQKMSEAHAQWWARLSEEERAQFVAGRRRHGKISTPPWNKGKKLSPEHVQKLKDAKRPPISVEQRRKLSEAARRQWERQRG